MFTTRYIFPIAAAAAFVLTGINVAEAAPSGKKKASPRPAEEMVVPRLDSVIPPSRQGMDEQIEKGVRFLINTQNKDGSWGDHGMTKGLNVLCPVPGGPLAFRSAVTSLDVIGLYYASPEDPDVNAALDKAEQWLLENLPKIRRTDDSTILNFWSHAYGIRSLCVLSKRVSPQSQTYAILKKECKNQIDRLMAAGDAAGGWGYYEFDSTSYRANGLPTSFCTATALLALKEAEKTFGLKGNKKIVDKAVKFLKNQRTPVGTYVYSSDHMLYPTGLINRQTGSLARSPACNVALYSYGNKAVDKQQIEDSLDWLWARGGWLEMARKRPVPHEGWAANAGYFFYYGYFYASLSIETLDKDKQARHASFLAHALLPLQEADGSWWDYPLYNYHKPYGTGYTLYSLSRAREILYHNQDTLVRS